MCRYGRVNPGFEPWSKRHADRPFARKLDVEVPIAGDNDKPLLSEEMVRRAWEVYGSPHDEDVQTVTESPEAGPISEGDGRTWWLAAVASALSRYNAIECSKNDDANGVPDGLC
jgi:hypothetical protein